MAEEVKNDLRYQWFKDGSPVDKAGESIELSLLKLSDTGIYNCIVTCDRLEDWNVKSDPLNVAVNRELRACSRILYLLRWYNI